MIENCRDLLSKAQNIIAKDAQIVNERKRHGDFFNIFSVLGAETKEIRHSAFIAELLNPNGSHGAGDVFLKSFLDMLGKTQRADSDENKVLFSASEFDFHNATVSTEEDLGGIHETARGQAGGRADITINLNKDGKPFYIVIENKIYAGDQNFQLSRYEKSLKQLHGDKCEYFLVYLTLDGHNPSEGSAEGIDKNRLLLISYREDIKSWVTKNIQHTVSLPSVRESIVQYIHLINKLTNQEMDKTMSDEITNMLLEGNNYEVALKISGNLVNAKKAFFKDWMIKNVFEKIHIDGFKFEIDAWNDPASEDFNFGEFVNDNGFKIAFGFLYRNYQGFCAMIGNQYFESLNEEQKSKLKNVLNTSLNWAWFTPIEGFKNFNDDMIVSILKDSSAIKKAIEEAINKITQALK